MAVRQRGRSRARERQAEGQRRGAVATNAERWGVASGSEEPEAITSARTNDVVADEVGTDHGDVFRHLL